MEVLDDNGNVIPKSSQESKRVLAGVLGILLGVFGVHKFVLATQMKVSFCSQLLWLLVALAER